MTLYHLTIQNSKSTIKKIYPKDLELKETTENNFGCSYLDIYVL